MIDSAEYTRLRNYILHFLMRGSHATPAPAPQQAARHGPALSALPLSAAPSSHVPM
jgi:hypothetical protein